MKPRLILALAALTVFWCGAAQARPRDDVMAGAFRCAVIGDGHLWLDCYYGAAQLLRSQLGLSPALPAQIRLAAAPPAGTGVPAQDARARDAVMSEAFRCTDIDNDRQWLNCYYSAAQPMRTLLGLSPAPQAPARSGTAPLPGPLAGNAAPAGAQTQSGSDFGLAARPARSKTADRIVSRMADFKFDSYGVFTVTLANGQVWQQLGGDTAHAALKRPAEKYTVTIKHGFFGSYNLTIAGLPGLYRVLRIV